MTLLRCVTSGSPRRLLRRDANRTRETGSQMPRHLISDAHEWINEIPTVPVYYLAKPQPRERAWPNQRGKKTLDGTAAQRGIEIGRGRPRALRRN